MESIMSKLYDSDMERFDLGSMTDMCPELSVGKCLLGFAENGA